MFSSANYIQIWLYLVSNKDMNIDSNINIFIFSDINDQYKALLSVFIKQYMQNKSLCKFMPLILHITREVIYLWNTTRVVFQKSISNGLFPTSNHIWKPVKLLTSFIMIVCVCVSENIFRENKLEDKRKDNLQRTKNKLLEPFVPADFLFHNWSQS